MPSGCHRLRSADQIRCCTIKVARTWLAKQKKKKDCLLVLDVNAWAAAAAADCVLHPRCISMPTGTHWWLFNLLEHHDFASNRNWTLIVRPVGPDRADPMPPPPPHHTHTHTFRLDFSSFCCFWPPLAIFRIIVQSDSFVSFHLFISLTWKKRPVPCFA